MPEQRSPKDPRKMLMLLRPGILTFAAILTSLGLVACTDSNSPTAAVPPAGELGLTPSSGVTNETLVRANAGILKVHSNYNGFRSNLATKDNTDIVVNRNTMAPGGTSGWHTHPGPTIVVIKSGALTLYDAKNPHDESDTDDAGDSDCVGTTYTAGQVFVETGGNVHIARNEGTVGAEWYTTYIAPAGGATRIDAPTPGNCPF